MEAGQVLVKTPVTLLPQGQEDGIAFAEEHESSLWFLRFARYYEAEYVLIEPRGTIQVADVQSNVPCPESLCIQSHRPLLSSVKAFC